MGSIPELIAIMVMFLVTVIISRKVRASFDAKYAAHSDAKAKAALAAKKRG